MRSEKGQSSGTAKGAEETTTQETMKGVERLEAAIKYLRREIHEEIPAQQILLLLAVARNPGITHAGIKETYGLHPGAISRNLKQLGHYLNAEKKLSGFGLIEQRPDLYHRLRLGAVLTEKGTEVVRKLDEIILG